MSMTRTRPQGREQIRAAVLDAARELVAECGPDGFSVRDVAARADINHALVHRHFGTKADVLQEVLQQEAGAVAEAIAHWGTPSPDVGVDGAAELLELLAGFPSYWRALLHAVVETPEVAVAGTDATTALFREMWRAGGSTDPARSALAGASALGYLVFGAFMSETTGADPDDVRRLAAGQVAGLMGVTG
jgi:AcrR family transcriptional regulator